MKNSLSRGLKCLKCFVIFYLVFICILGLGVAVFASFLLLFRKGRHIPEPRNIILYFLTVPTILTISSTILGWWSIKKKHTNFLKFFAVIVAVTATLEISGCLWCFMSLPEVKEEIKSELKMTFGNITTSDSNQNWWDNLQVELECCGVHGPTDYHTANSIPFSCCGSDPTDQTKGSCTFLWQKGCSNAVIKQISNDLMLLSLLALCNAMLQIPGVFLSCCFARKIQKERL